MSGPSEPYPGSHPQQTPQQSSVFTHIARQPSWNGSVEDSPSHLKDPQHSRKRSADHLPSEPHVARKGRACLACRKLKVKCDSLERGDAGCSRCQRLSLECVTSKRMRVSLEDDNEYVNPAIRSFEALRARPNVNPKKPTPINCAPGPGGGGNPLPTQNASAGNVQYDRHI